MAKQLRMLFNLISFIVNNLLSGVSSDVYCQSTITENTNDHHIYMKWQEGERAQDAGETERERERECVREREGSCKLR